VFGWVTVYGLKAAFWLSSNKWLMMNVALELLVLADLRLKLIGLSKVGGHLHSMPLMLRSLNESGKRLQVQCHDDDSSMNVVFYCYCVCLYVFVIQQILLKSKILVLQSGLLPRLLVSVSFFSLFSILFTS